MYCQFIYGMTVPALDDKQWPPAEEDWIAFLNDARAQVSSYKRFTGVVGTVCEVGSRYFYGAGRVAPGAQGLLDPRVIYSASHRRTMRLLRREYGSSMRQVAGITMQEALNAHLFIDKNTIKGLAMGAAFYLGVCHGGRRPRTITAMRVSDAVFTAESVKVAGRMVLVPAVELIFKEEKYDDIQGPRSGTETYRHMDDYLDYMHRGSAFWLYQLLVLRGAFIDGDPIRTAAPGQKLHVRPEALDWFLLCYCRKDMWIDTCPVSVQILGHWTKKVLSSMGSPERGFSAHRRGCVTRAVVMCILKSKGRAIPVDQLNVMIRWGGWQAVTGVMTVMRTYAHKIMDRYLDVFGLAFGREGSDAEWQARLDDYMGIKLSRVSHSDAEGLPMQIKVHAWQTDIYSAMQSMLNSCVGAIMHVA